MKIENKEQFYEVITEQAVEISRLRKKISALDRDVTRLTGVVQGQTRERERLVAIIKNVGEESRI